MCSTPSLLPHLASPSEPTNRRIKETDRPGPVHTSWDVLESPHNTMSSYHLATKQTNPCFMTICVVIVWPSSIMNHALY